MSSSRDYTFIVYERDFQRTFNLFTRDNEMAMTTNTEGHHIVSGKISGPSRTRTQLLQMYPWTIDIIPVPVDPIGPVQSVRPVLAHGKV